MFIFTQLGCDSVMICICRHGVSHTESNILTDPQLSFAAAYKQYTEQLKELAPGWLSVAITVNRTWVHVSSRKRFNICALIQHFLRINTKLVANIGQLTLVLSTNTCYHLLDKKRSNRKWAAVNNKVNPNITDW